MKPLRIAQDIVPIGEFKGQAAHYLKVLAETDQTMIITQNGKPAGVLISPNEYDRMNERQRLLEDVTAGLAELDAGLGVDTDELRRKLAAARLARAAR